MNRPEVIRIVVRVLWLAALVAFFALMFLGPRFNAAAPGYVFYWWDPSNSVAAVILMQLVPFQDPRPWSSIPP